MANYSFNINIFLFNPHLCFSVFSAIPNDAALGGTPPLTLRSDLNAPFHTHTHIRNNKKNSPLRAQMQASW